MATPPNLSHIEVKLDRTTGVGSIKLARVRKLNAINFEMWGEIPVAAAWLREQPETRVVVLFGSGQHFCVGIDISQELPMPVIAGVHGYCYGAAIDLITCCDLRYSTEDATFCVKEVDVGITADIGTLQRLPGIVGDGVARELALTARAFSGMEAKRIGLVTDALPTFEAMLLRVNAVAEEIASKSPLAVQGTKAVLLHKRDNTVAAGLDYVATRNMGLLISADLTEAMTAKMQKRRPMFAKL